MLSAEHRRGVPLDGNEIRNLVEVAHNSDELRGWDLNPTTQYERV